MEKDEIIIHSTHSQHRIAFIEKGQFAHFYMESEDITRSIGSIYLGIVRRVIPGINAAFIDVGERRDVFLHFSDSGEYLQEHINFLNPEQQVNLNSVEVSDSETVNYHNLSNYDKQNVVSKFLKPGHNLLVQITKDPIGNKSARGTANITFKGNYFILVSMANYVSVSRYIRGKKERIRLRNIVLKNVNKQNKCGIIVKKSANNIAQDVLEDDLAALIKKWSDLINKIKKSDKAALVYKNLGVFESILNHRTLSNYNKIIADKSPVYHFIKKHVNNIIPDKENIVQLYRNKKHIFSKMGIAEEINALFSKRVPLPSKGYLIIEQTEAMYVIDVNSGAYSGEDKQEDNSLATNLEAIEEISKQIRLRDIGGIIVIDFIDLRDKENRDKVNQAMKQALKKDSAKTNIIGMGDFGLVQITRQRMRSGLMQRISYRCPTCSGKSRVFNKSTILGNFEEILIKFKNSKSNIKHIYVYVHSMVYPLFNQGLFPLRMKWRWKYGIRIKYIQTDDISLNRVKITLPDSDIDIYDRLLSEDVDMSLLKEEVERLQKEKDDEAKEEYDVVDKEKNEKSTKNINRHPKHKKHNTRNQSYRHGNNKRHSNRYKSSNKKHPQDTTHVS